MRVAYLSTDRGIAYGGAKGAAVHVEELATALACAGADVLLLVADQAASAPAPYEGLTVEIVPGPGKGASADERLAAEPSRVSWLEERLRAFGADVLYERLALYSGAGSEVARRLRLPHVVELNAPLLAEAKRYRQLERINMADRLERRTLANADIVLAVSRPLAGYARERGARRVEVLPNAVDPARYPRAQQRSNGHPPVAVFAGSLRPWHGIDCLAEAWDLLGDAAPDLLVVGDGPGRSLLERIDARMTGAVPHAMVPELLARADIGLALYAADAPDYFSPLKLFEYLAAGLATIASDLPGVREAVGPEAAVLMPRGDARGLADAVAALVADPAGRKRLGDAGRALVLAEHTWDHRARTVLDLATTVDKGLVEPKFGAASRGPDPYVVYPGVGP
jgi:glycosyltransferase involved in cell wall biosynthesis